MLSISIKGIPDSVLKSTTPELLTRDIDLIVGNTSELHDEDKEPFLFFLSYCSPIGAEETILIEMRLTRSQKTTRRFIKAFSTKIGKRVGNYFKGFRISCILELISPDRVWITEGDTV